MAPLQSSVSYYEWLLTLLRQPALREGRWELLHSNDDVLAWQWTLAERVYHIRVNYGTERAEVQLPRPSKGNWRHFLGPELTYYRVTLGPYQWLVVEGESV